MERSKKLLLPAQVQPLQFHPVASGRCRCAESKSFLVRFFKKGLLAFYCAPVSADRRKDRHRRHQAGLLIRLHAQGLDVAGVFWGLWLPARIADHPLRLIPKLSGVFSIIGGVGWLLGAGASLIMPGLVPDGVAASCSRIAMLPEMGKCRLSSGC